MLPAQLASLLVFLAPPAAAQEAPAPSSPAPGSTAAGAHERMRALMDEIYRKTPDESPFLGTKRMKDLRARWAAVNEKTGAVLRWTLARDLGNAELEQGNEKEAIEALTAAVQAVDTIPFNKLDMTKIDAKGEFHDLARYYHNLTLFELGVAYLRYGETQNCCLRHTGESCIMPIRGAALHTAEEGSRGAIRCFEEILNNRPEKPEPMETKDCLRRAQWLLNVAYMTLGEYPAGVPKEYLVDIDQLFHSEVPFPRFENVLPKLGLDTFDLSGGTIVDDFDGDDDLDIVLSSWDTTGPMHFFENRGDGTFADRTAAANLTGFYGGLNITQADYDNDGDTDVFVPRGAWMRSYGKQPASLMRNDGHGVFTDVSFDAGFEKARFPGKTGAWADYDLDGDLDVYVGFDFGEGYTDSLPQLYRNDGDGTFTECAKAAGVQDPIFVMGASWGDYDEDRYPDLFVGASGNTENSLLSQLYHNNGDGTFENVTEKAGIHPNKDPFPVWMWDYDNDGHLDIYVSCRAGTVAVLADPSLRIGYDSLYRGDGKGGFVDVARQVGMTHPALPMGSNFGDLDGDGYLDAYLGTGFAPYAELHPNVMYLSLKGERFTNVTMLGGFGHLQKGHGVAFADLDADGDQDVYVNMGGAFPGDKFSDALFENPGFGNHWITLDLEGVRSNRSAIGTRLRLEIVEDGRKRSIYRHVNSGGSYGSSPLRQNVGIGKATSVATLEVFWPRTGETQVFHDVPADRAFRIVEGKDELVPFGLQRTHLGGDPAPEPATRQGVVQPR